MSRTHVGPAPMIGAADTPGPEQMLKAVLDLSRSVQVDTHVDEIVHAYVDCFKRLFPGRLFCVRLFSDDSGSCNQLA